MAYEQRDNSGAIFKNDKGDNPKRPDYKGKLMVAGVVYRVSAWVRVSQNVGDKFLSLALDVDEQRPPLQEPEQADGEGGNSHQETAADGLPF